MICNNSNNHHDINCKYYKNNNALKGASASAAVNQQPKQFVFNKSELNIVSQNFRTFQIFYWEESKSISKPTKHYKGINYCK